MYMIILLRCKFLLDYIKLISLLSTILYLFSTQNENFENIKYMKVIKYTIIVVFLPANELN